MSRRASAPLGRPRSRRPPRPARPLPSAASVAAYRVYRLIALAVFLAVLVAAAVGADGAITPDRAAERAVLERTNAVRAARGLAPLEVDGELSRVARAHSCEMARESFFGHRSPANGGLGERIREAGTPIARAGENLAYVSGDDPVGKAVQGWLESPSHRANLLDRRFTVTGIGVCGAGQGRYFTQVFARPRGPAAG